MEKNKLCSLTDCMTMGLLSCTLMENSQVDFTKIFSALVRVGEEDGAAQQRAADRGCAANQRWGMAAAATPQSIIQRSSPSDAFSPGIKNFTVLIELDLLDNNITALPAELGLLEPNLQVLKLDGNPLIRNVKGLEQVGGMEGLHFVALARRIGTHEVVHHGPVIVDDEVQPEALHRFLDPNLCIV
ncbi:uncharacterized protein LOC120672876 isoform X4 [Panicum virgatum]|uniref:uncharacterized protein LOC120672876 isoform X4 n=1 Tax=Panicum virgatum TaxID=38727 RepID=UPI0019D530C1|nr:uncharacterized protein LOC120672876 isoform X4 [Panicum virgatum]XP_039809419.1 uncharacterized protein LOC120672876 isoform X4 [Panicum virgatum]